MGFLEPLTERKQESQTVGFLSFNGGDQFTLTCPGGETTDPITWQTNNIILGENMVAALQAKCGGDFFTTGPNDEREVIFGGSFEGTNVPQMTCTVVSGNGSCEIIAESDGAPGALLPGTGQATEGMAVDPDLDGAGPEKDILYILRDPSGNGNGTTRVEQIGPVNAPGLTAAPTDDDAQHGGKFGFNNTIGFGLDPVAGHLFVSSTDNPPGPLPGGSRVYIVGDLPVEPVAEIDSITEIGKTSAKVSATINPKTSPSVPNPPASTAQLEYRLTTDSGWKKYGPEVDLPAEDADTNTSLILGGLVPNREYEVRYSLTNEYGGETFGAPETFLTLPAPPQIEGFFATNVQKSTADLVAVINPLGQATNYRFEYGTTPEFGSVAPVPDGEITTDLLKSTKVITSLEGLQGVPYYFRVIAENEAGTTTSAEQTFTFYPPACPNSQLRQQTSSAYLPDCRAYELVSPPRAESTILTYEGPVSPTASNPSRFGFTGLLGLLPGTGEPLGIFGDVYISTRTSTGWVTHYVGIRGSEGAVVGGPPNLGGGPNGTFASNDLGKLIDWDNGQQGYICCGADGSFAGTCGTPKETNSSAGCPRTSKKSKTKGSKTSPKVASKEPLGHRPTSAITSSPPPMCPSPPTARRPAKGSPAPSTTMTWKPKRWSWPRGRRAGNTSRSIPAHPMSTSTSRIQLRDRTRASRRMAHTS